MKTYWCTLLFISLATGLVANDAICGIYEFTDNESNEKARVCVTKNEQSNKYVAQIIWLENPYNPDGSLILDLKNPDKSLRNTPANQIYVIKNLVYNTAKNQWESKELYHPVHGRYFSVYMTFETPNKLKLRGYLGTPSIGKTQYWTKIK